MIEKNEIREHINHTDPDGNVCEYDGYIIDPSKYISSGKTMKELQAEAEALRESIMGPKK